MKVPHLPMNESIDYLKIEVDPLFEPIKKFFEFYILGVGFISNPDFQRIFLLNNPAISPVLDAYNKEVNLQSDGKAYKASTKIFLTSVGRMMAVSIFDFLEASDYRGNFQDTEIYRFARHVRNGSAHNDQFNFNENDVIQKPAKWREKVIEKSLIGKPVVPNFMNPITMLYLMSDITEMIKTFKE